MNETNEKMIKRIEKAQKDRKKLTHITNKNELSTEERFKLALCKHFVQYAYEKRMKLKDLAEKTGIPSTRLSEITNYKIKKFTVDQLLKNLSILGESDPAIREFLLMLGAAFELPLMKPVETKKLTKKIKEAQKFV